MFVELVIMRLYSYVQFPFCYIEMLLIIVFYGNHGDCYQNCSN